jgi:rod shape-determining protein MreD
MSAVMIVNFVLQSSLFQYIEILGVRPNSALILIVSYSILRGDVEGALLGFFAGLLQDVYFGSYVGLHALLGLLAGYFCGKPFKDFFRENYFLPLSLVAVCSLLFQTAYYAADFLFRAKTEFLFYTSTIILPGTVYTLILTVPFYSLVYGINNWLETIEKSKRKLF